MPPKYRDELINQPPREKPLDIGGYALRRDLRRPPTPVPRTSVAASGAIGGRRLSVGRSGWSPAASGGSASSSTPPGSSAEDVEEDRVLLVGVKRRGRPPKRRRAKQPRLEEETSTPPGSPSGTGPVEPQGRGAAGGAVAGAVEFTEDWTSVGGLERQLQVLQESVVAPLVAPERFACLGLRGGAAQSVLLTGSAGCGKTLCVRALVGSLQKAGVPVTLLVRKGADTLSKYVGEGERRLKELFAQAKENQPAIIFFDEIDGLAPTRTSESASVHHTSLVTTLLALMDGMEHRGERVVVIGATNRPDALDPALRRPGRFDKELHFEPPKTAEQRRAILEICVRRWDANMRPGEAVLDWISRHTENFTGADLNALVREAGTMAVNRAYRHRQTSPEKEPTATGGRVTGDDFVLAMRTINPNRALDFSPASYGGGLGWARLPVSPVMRQLFSAEIAGLTSFIQTAIGGGEDDRWRQHAGVPNFFKNNAVYIKTADEAKEHPAVFRHAVLRAAIENFSDRLHTVHISAHSEAVLGGSATALVHSALKSSPALVLVDDSLFDASLLLSTNFQHAVVEALQAVLLPGNRVFGVFLSQTSQRISSSIPCLTFAPRLETASIRKRIREVLTEQAEFSVREAKAELKNLRDSQDLHMRNHERFRQEVERVLGSLAQSPRLQRLAGHLKHMKRKNQRSQYLAIDEVFADVAMLARDAEQTLGEDCARHFKDLTMLELATIDKQLLEKVVAAREAISRQLLQEEDRQVQEDDQQHDQHTGLPKVLLQLISDKVNELDVGAKQDWDHLAYYVVNAVRFVEAKARELTLS